MPTANPHALIEMTDEPDCRFVASWLAKVAEAQTFWSDALNGPDFADRVLVLHADEIPNLAAGALEILGELQLWHGVVALALCEDDYSLLGREFAIMLRLGFFVAVGRSYRLDIPKQVTLAAVKRAALDVLSAVKDEDDGIEVLQPERLMQTLPREEAEAEHEIMMAMRRFRMITASKNRSARPQDFPG